MVKKVEGETVERLAPLKERARQLTLYLDPEVYDRLRDIAHEERTKMHPLILEGIALMMKKRSKRTAA